MHTPPVRGLGAAAGVEAASLTVLLANLLTVHAEPVASLVGPVHGTAYLAVLAVTFLPEAAGTPGLRRRAAVPGIGGLLALRLLRRRARLREHPA